MKDFLKYHQSTGFITLNNSQNIVAKGWAGKGDGRNNPAMQTEHCLGPLPQGWYTIGGWEEHHNELGPMVAALWPDESNEMFGRDSFYFHGPSMDPAEYGQESKGCIVLPHAQRQKVKDTGIIRLNVVA